MQRQTEKAQKVGNGLVQRLVQVRPIEVREGAMSKLRNLAANLEDIAKRLGRIRDGLGEGREKSDVQRSLRELQEVIAELDLAARREP